MKNNKSIVRVVNKLEQLSEKSENTRTVNKFFSSDGGIYSTDGVRAIWVKPYSGIYTRHLTVDDSNPLHFNKLVDNPHIHLVRFEVNELKKAIQAVKYFSDMVVIERTDTGFTFKPLKPKSNDLKNFTIELAGLHDAPDEAAHLKIGFTCKYLIDALQVVKTSGEKYVELSICSTLRPVVVTGIEYDNSLKQLLSPVRLPR